MCIRLCEADVVVEEHVFEMRNRWGKGKREWGANGGGEVSIQPTRDLSGRESYHDAKEGFQVSRKGIRECGQGFQVKGGYQRDWVMHSDIMLILYILC
jgi:hypothetical protein